MYYGYAETIHLDEERPYRRSGARSFSHTGEMKFEMNPSWVPSLDGSSGVERMPLV